MWFSLSAFHVPSVTAGIVVGEKDPKRRADHESDHADDNHYNDSNGAAGSDCRHQCFGGSGNSFGSSYDSFYNDIADGNSRFPDGNGSLLGSCGRSLRGFGSRFSRLLGSFSCRLGSLDCDFRSRLRGFHRLLCHLR